MSILDERIFEFRLGIVRATLKSTENFFLPPSKINPFLDGFDQANKLPLNALFFELF